MAADEEEIVARLERPERLDRRLRVERPGVADEQAERLRHALTAGLIRGEQTLRASRWSHQRAGGSQRQRERFTTSEGSIVHRHQVSKNTIELSRRRHPEVVLKTAPPGARARE